MPGKNAIGRTFTHTCYHSGANASGYLTQLQCNGDCVRAAPSDWMPWNYQQQLTGADQSPVSPDSPPSEAEMHGAPTPDG
jgi:hypothetical protein